MTVPAPGFAGHDAVGVRKTHVISAGDCLHTFAICTRIPHANHIRPCQFRHRVRLPFQSRIAVSAVRNCVIHVLGQRNPLKVMRVGVFSVEVNVVNLSGAMGVRYERNGHQPVYVMHDATVVSPQVHNEIPCFGDGSFHYPLRCDATSTIFEYHCSAQALHAAAVRDLVQTFVSGHRLPLFTHEVSVSGIDAHCNGSTKSRAKWHGYGQSAFDINRGYVRQVLQRAPAYAPHWGGWIKDRNGIPLE